MSTRHDTDLAIDAVARAQHGVFSRADAADAGASSKMVRARVATGRWIQLAPSVFALASHPPTWHRQAAAAVLATPGSILSGRPAARLHGLDISSGRMEVVLPASSGGRSPLASVRRSAWCDPVRVDGIPVNSLVQTVVDLVLCASPSDFDRMAEDALITGGLTPWALERRVAEVTATRRPGNRVLREFVGSRLRSLQPLDSEMERRLRVSLADPTIPGFEMQLAPSWSSDRIGRVDSAIPAWRLVVEADGRGWHSSMDAMANDRARDLELASHGWEVRRLTWSMLTKEPAETLRALAAVGRRRATLPAPTPLHPARRQRWSAVTTKRRLSAA